MAGGSAAGRLVTLVLEQLVADAHLDVVGLTREEQQRLVLCLPSETSDRAVVAVVVGSSTDPERALQGRVACGVARNSRVGNLFHQTQSERWGRNPEDDVP